MADVIRFDSEVYAEISTQMIAVSDALGEISNILGTINTSAEWWSKPQYRGSVSLKTCGTFSFGDMPGAVRSLRQAAGKVADISETISENVKKSAEIFENAEELCLSRVLSGGTESDVFNASGEADGGTQVVFPNGFKLLGTADTTKVVSTQDADAARLFDDEGQYGSDQGSAVTNYTQYDDYAALIKKNTGKELNHSQLTNYLRIMNSEGCGYAAMVNSIMLAYEGRSEDFKRDFGYDMYVWNAKTGQYDLNYDMLTVDLYSATNNKKYDRSGNIKYIGDDKITVNNKNGTLTYQYKEKGTSRETIGDKLNMFLDSKGIKYSYNSDIPLTPKNYSEYAQKGTVTLYINSYTDLSGWYMYDSNGKRYIFSGTRGHAMTVTGVDSKGRYIVSSWGDTYYVDPKKCGWFWKEVHFSLTTIDK